MKLEDRYRGILEWFRQNAPLPKPELVFSNAYELLVAVILSAQCTDKRVNIVTPALFRKYPDPASLAKASAEDILKLIGSVSYPNSKAAHLAGMARRLTDEFGGEVPDDIEALMTLPGVGRKTANVVTSVIYNRPVIAVDTHVFRVAHRLGLSNGRTPLAVEKDLERHIPEALRPAAHHWLILHGRYICTARNKKCSSCPIRSCCKDFGKRNQQN